jgi:hypothetical protein
MSNVIVLGNIKTANWGNLIKIACVTFEKNNNLWLSTGCRSIVSNPLNLEWFNFKNNILVYCFCSWLKFNQKFSDCFEENWHFFCTGIERTGFFMTVSSMQLCLGRYFLSRFVSACAWWTCFKIGHVQDVSNPYQFVITVRVLLAS